MCGANEHSFYFFKIQEIKYNLDFVRCRVAIETLYLQSIVNSLKIKHHSASWPSIPLHGLYFYIYGVYGYKYNRGVNVKPTLLMLTKEADRTLSHAPLATYRSFPLSIQAIIDYNWTLLSWLSSNNTLNHTLKITDFLWCANKIVTHTTF